MKLCDVIDLNTTKVMVADEPEHLVFCGSIHDPGSFRGLWPYLSLPVIAAQPCGTYLLITIGKEVLE